MKESPFESDSPDVDQLERLLRLATEKPADR